MQRGKNHQKVRYSERERSLLRHRTCTPKGNVSIIRGFDNPISSIRVSRVSVMVSVRDSVK